MTRRNTSDPTRAFLGVGWAFPLSVDADGTLAEVAYDEDIRQAIRIILGTNQGERVMRPEFGADLRRFVFEPVSTTTMAQIKTRVQEALIDWERRIDVQDISVTSPRGQSNVILIEMTYRVRATNTVNNLVYPFYLQEGTAP